MISNYVYEVLQKDQLQLGIRLVRATSKCLVPMNNTEPGRVINMYGIFTPGHNRLSLPAIYRLRAVCGRGKYTYP